MREGKLSRGGLALSILQSLTIKPDLPLAMVGVEGEVGLTMLLIYFLVTFHLNSDTKISNSYS